MGLFFFYAFRHSIFYLENLAHLTFKVIFFSFKVIFDRYVLIDIFLIVF